VMSFTLLRLLDALPGCSRPERRYWPHTVWVVLLLYMCASFWWLSWFNRTLETLSFRYFLFLLFLPSLLFVTATTLVSASPAEVTSWREHFDKVRARFFLGAFVYMLLISINSYVTFEVPLDHRIRIAQASLLIVFGCGAALKSERAQAILAGTAGVLLTWNLVQVLVFGDLPISIE